MIFDICDFDSDNLVHIQDIKMILTNIKHITYQTKKTDSVSSEILKNQNNSIDIFYIDQLLKITFNDNKILDYNQFQGVVLTSNTEFFESLII